MLCITRRADEAFILRDQLTGRDIKVTCQPPETGKGTQIVLRIDGEDVRLNFARDGGYDFLQRVAIGAPRRFSIIREELL